MPFLVLSGVKDFTWQITYLRLNRKVVKSVPLTGSLAIINQCPL